MLSHSRGWLAPRGASFYYSPGRFYQGVTARHNGFGSLSSKTDYRIKAEASRSVFTARGREEWRGIIHGRGGKLKARSSYIFQANCTIVPRCGARTRPVRSLRRNGAPRSNHAHRPSMPNRERGNQSNQSANHHCRRKNLIHVVFHIREVLIATRIAANRLEE